MSNWLRAKVSTEIKNPKPSLFKKALKNMGFYPDYSDKTVHGSFSFEATEQVDCVLHTIDGDKPTTIGFIFEETPDNKTQLKISGDFYGLGYDGPEFLKKLAMQYNFEVTKEAMESQGFTIEETTAKEDQIVVVGYRQVA